MELVIFRVKLFVDGKVEIGNIPAFTDDVDKEWQKTLTRLKEDGNILASEEMDIAQEPEFKEIRRKD